MERGFLAVWYKGKGTASGTDDLWFRSVMGALRSFRFHHPGEVAGFVDIDGQLNALYRHEVFDRLGFIDLAAHYRARGINWEHNLFAKAQAMAASPFQDTCLFDLDFVFTGSIADVFDRPERHRGGIGVMGYPNYRSPFGRAAHGWDLNLGLWVMDKAEARGRFWLLYFNQAAIRPEMQDEGVLQDLVNGGCASVWFIPAAYAMDPTAWFAHPARPMTGPFCSWEAHLVVDRTSKPWDFRLGSVDVRAFHLSGARRTAYGGNQLMSDYQAYLTQNMPACLTRCGGCQPDGSEFQP